MPRKINCIYLIEGEQCSNEKVKKSTFGWGKTLCKEFVDPRAVCIYKQGHPKPLAPPSPPRKTN